MIKPRRLYRNGVVLLLGAVIGGCMLREFEHQQVYYPDRTFSVTGAELNRPFEDVSFSAADDVKLNGWFFPAAEDSARADWVVLVCHGNAGNISHRLATAEALLATGVGVFLFDYRGYGRSHGRPSEEGTYLDAVAAHAWLRQKGFAAERIIAYGESLGGGIASELAVRERLGGLVLQSTFTSITDLGSELFPWLPVRWLATIKYDTRSKLPRLRTPVLVMHSRLDELVGFHHGQHNYATARDPKLFWEIRGFHNDPVSDRTNYIAGMEKFLRLAGANGW